MDLHEKYGKVVRTSPNEICISDLIYAKMIYGANSHFLKSDRYSTVEPEDDDAVNLLESGISKNTAINVRLLDLYLRHLGLNTTRSYKIGRFFSLQRK
jgi:hypothetical protein